MNPSTSSAQRPPSVNGQPSRQIAAFLEAILVPNSDCVCAPQRCAEIRVLNASMERNGTITSHPTYQATFAAWFDDPDDVLVAIRSIRGVSAYITTNPLDSALLARSNRLAKQKATSTDSDVRMLRNVLLDFDAKRPSGISSTDSELAAALARRDQVLADHPEIAAASIWGCSGNGGFILVGLPDYPNDEPHRVAVKEFVDLLSGKYTDQVVELDPTTCNPARIMALVGTVKCKGVNTPERPHRMVELHSDPAKVRQPLDLLAWLDQHRPAPAPSTPPHIGNGQATGSPWSMRSGDIETRAIAYLATCEGAVDGQKGSAKCFGVACRVGPGFDLPEDVALRIIRDHYNPRCEPPWTEKELVHKVKSAYARVKHRGWLLQERKAKSVHGGTVTPKKSRQNKAASTASTTDSRPQIEITTDEHIVVDQALDAIKNDPALFQRGGLLAIVTRSSSAGKKKGVVERPDGSVQIQLMPRAALRRIMSRNARWVMERLDRQGVPYLHREHVPGWAVEQLWDLRRWPGVRHLEGVIEAPTMRPDGSLLAEPGYDDETGLLFLPSGDFPQIPDNPTIIDAYKAVAELVILVQDFPFADEDHKFAFLAALLTPLVRFGVQGPCPLFLFDANCAGSGKTKLCDIIAILATGREMPRSRYQSDDAEMDKSLLAIAPAGDRLMLFDNVPTGFSVGGGSLDAALTGFTKKGRILGESRMSGDVPLTTVFYASGNNLGLRGDALRRVVPIRLETKLDRPEERTDIKEKDLLGYVKRERGRLVAAALTLVRAYVVAGKPEVSVEVEDPATKQKSMQKLTPMDYPAWCVTRWPGAQERTRARQERSSSPATRKPPSGRDSSKVSSSFAIRSARRMSRSPRCSTR
jgi:hypothetical protein